MSILFISAVAQAADDGLTLSDIVADIPHDPAAFVVYAMLLVSGLLIWRANRRRTKV